MKVYVVLDLESGESNFYDVFKDKSDALMLAEEMANQWAFDSSNVKEKNVNGNIYFKEGVHTLACVKETELK